MLPVDTVSYQDIIRSPWDIDVITVIIFILKIGKNL